MNPDEPTVFAKASTVPDSVPSRFLSDRTLRRAFLFGIAFLCLFTAIKYYAKAEKPSRLGDQTRTAFLRWRPQVLALDDGRNIYDEFRYPNPPIMALILRPFMELPPLAGAMVWFFAKVGMAIAMIVWTFRLLAVPVADWVKGLAIALSLHPILGDLAHGNVNLFISFIVVGALECFRRRWDFTAGLAIGLAIACKVTPALFVPYFLWKRAWRALAGVIVGSMLWLAIVPGGVLGWEYNRVLLTSWFEHMVKPFAIDGKVTTEHPNQSIPGVVFRLLTAEPSFLEYDPEDGHPISSEFHNLADVGPANAKRIVQLAMLLFAIVIVALCRWPTHRANVPRAGPQLVAEFGLILIGMLLFSERTWKHHAVALIVPFSAICWAIGSTHFPKRTRIGIGAIFTVAVALMWLPSFMGSESQDMALVYGTHTAAFALSVAALMGILISFRRRIRRDAQALRSGARGLHA